MLSETDDGKSVEGLLYELIVIDGKYLSHVEIYDEVIHLLKNQPRAPSRDIASIQTPSTRGCCFKFCCMIPLCCVGNRCLKWLLKMIVFFWILICFIGTAVYIFQKIAS